MTGDNHYLTFVKYNGPADVKGWSKDSPDEPITYQQITVEIPHTFTVWKTYDNLAMWDVWEFQYTLAGAKYTVKYKVDDQALYKYPDGEKQAVYALGKFITKHMAEQIPEEAHDYVFGQVSDFLHKTFFGNKLTTKKSPLGYIKADESIKFAIPLVSEEQVKQLYEQAAVVGPWKKKSKVVNEFEISSASKGLPGMGAVVECPDEKCGFTEMDKYGEWSSFRYKAKLWSVVQHLNDYHKWSRDKIADWIDDLHDRGIINAEFEPWGEEPEPDKTELSESDKAIIAEVTAQMDKHIEEEINKGLDGWTNLGYTTIDEPKEFE